jgi:hypothetical protein
MGASVRLVPRAEGPPDLVLVGGGDAMLIDAADCVRDCLSDLADMVAANGVTRINDVIGDDALYPDQPWALGWSWEDLVSSGAATSALTVNNNEVALVVTPAATIGQPADVRWRDSDVLGGRHPYDLRSEVVTVASIEDDEDLVRIERRRIRRYMLDGLRWPLRLYRAGGDKPAVCGVAVRIPAEERGVVIDGTTMTSHRPAQLIDDPDVRKADLFPRLVREEQRSRGCCRRRSSDNFLMKQSQTCIRADAAAAWTR